MNQILCVTNRHLVDGDFYRQIETVANSDVSAIVLREKDLSMKEYEQMAAKVLDIGKKYKKTIILHYYYNVAIKLHWDKIQLPFHCFLEMSQEEKKKFAVVGVSVHSVEEGIQACNLGATYITAGHIFETDCKKGLAPRGLDFLKEVCESVTIPVYAIGGITLKRMDLCKDAGAAGVMMMSPFMKNNIIMNYK